VCIGGGTLRKKNSEITIMDEQIVFKQVVTHLSEFLEHDLSHLRMDSRLATALPDLDSLKVFEMILYLEECFGLKFDDSVIQNIETLGQLVAYISNLQAADSARP
jgi:acyl carrier protein